jgi:hypothetical protein
VSWRRSSSASCPSANRTITLAGTGAAGLAGISPVRTNRALGAGDRAGRPGPGRVDGRGVLLPDGHLVPGAEGRGRAAVDAGYLGAWDGECELTFGRDGKPMYISGPDDDGERTIRKLHRGLGDGNYDFVHMISG